MKNLWNRYKTPIKCVVGGGLLVAVFSLATKADLKRAEQDLQYAKDNPELFADNPLDGVERRQEIVAWKKGVGATGKVAGISFVALGLFGAGRKFGEDSDQGTHDDTAEQKSDVSVDDAAAGMPKMYTAVEKDGATVFEPRYM